MENYYTNFTFVMTVFGFSEIIIIFLFTFLSIGKIMWNQSNDQHQFSVTLCGIGSLAMTLFILTGCYFFV